MVSGIDRAQTIQLIRSMRVGRGTLHQPLSEEDMLRERASNKRRRSFRVSET
jgi:hypothetical protein